jgi:hypothetical protein
MSFYPVLTWSPHLTNPGINTNAAPEIVPFVPSDIAGMQLWLDAQDSASITIATGVSQWSDVSGNGRHFIQSVGANQPSYTGSGATAAVVFDGTNDSLSLSTPFITGLGSATIFMVLKPGTLATSKFFLSEDSSSSATPLNFIFATSSTTSTSGRNFLRNDSSSSAHNFEEANLWASNTDTIVSCLDADGSSNITIVKNGTAYSSRATNRTGTYTMTAVALARRVNGSTSSCTACTIREVLVYDSVLSTGDRQRVEGYLFWKWGLVSLCPSGHPYKNAPP